MKKLIILASLCVLFPAFLCASDRAIEMPDRERMTTFVQQHARGEGTEYITGPFGIMTYHNGVLVYGEKVSNDCYALNGDERPTFVMLKEAGEGSKRRRHAVTLVLASDATTHYYII